MLYEKHPVCDMISLGQEMICILKCIIFLLKI